MIEVIHPDAYNKIEIGMICKIHSTVKVMLCGPPHVSKGRPTLDTTKFPRI